MTNAGVDCAVFDRAVLDRAVVDRAVKVPSNDNILSRIAIVSRTVSRADPWVYGRSQRVRSPVAAISPRLTSSLARLLNVLVRIASRAIAETREGIERTRKSDGVGGVDENDKQGQGQRQQGDRRSDELRDSILGRRS